MELFKANQMFRMPSVLEGIHTKLIPINKDHITELYETARTNHFGSTIHSEKWAASKSLKISRDFQSRKWKQAKNKVKKHLENLIKSSRSHIS